MDQKNFIRQNQSLQKADVVAWVHTHIINKTTRKVQNNFNAVQCLESSIDNNMKKGILADKEDCKIASVIIAALLFNIIMIKSEPSGMGTVRALNQEIRALDTIIPTMKINQFNDHVNGLITTLSSHGVIMPDLMDHLFAACRKAADIKFREHMIDIEHKWLRAEVQYAHYTANQLMADALAEYKPARQRQTFTMGRSIRGARRNSPLEGRNQESYGRKHQEEKEAHNHSSQLSG